MKFLKSIYHYFLAWLGSVIYGNPSRKIFVLGVTGTKGKSTVLELINAILESAGKKTALLSSVRLKIGEQSRPNLTENTMPGRFFIQRFLSQAVRSHCDYALLEVTSEGVLQYRHRFIDFDAALFLNLHPEHIERHGSFENYRAAKVKFLSDIARTSQKPKKLFFINQEDVNSSYFTDAVQERGKVYYFGREQFIENRLARGKVSIGDWLGSGFNLENAAAATSFAESLGIDWAITRSALASFKGLIGRMEVVQKEPFRVVIDYAHTPDSLLKVYQTLQNRGQKSEVPPQGGEARPDAYRGGRSQRLICVLGSAGGGRDKWKRPELGKIAAEYCREIILTNEDPYNEKPEQILEEIESGFSQIPNNKFQITKNYSKILDRREAIKRAIALAKRGDTVIITGKGSEHWLHLAGGKRLTWDERKTVAELLSY